MVTFILAVEDELSEVEVRKALSDLEETLVGKHNCEIYDAVAEDECGNEITGGAS